MSSRFPALASLPCTRASASFAVYACSLALLVAPLGAMAQTGSSPDTDPYATQTGSQQTYPCTTSDCLNNAVAPLDPSTGQVNAGQTIGGDSAAPNAQSGTVRARTGDAGDDVTQTNGNRQTSQQQRTPATRNPDYPSVQRSLPTTDFERYVQSSTGHALRTYGMDFFRTGSALDFSASSTLAAPADFVIGPADQIRIRATGAVSIDVLATVDRNGFIFVPEVGTVQVAGMQLSQAETAIRSAVSRQFRNFELSVTLGQLRSIQVFLLGDARQPGVHTISALSTLINALFASGGPSPTGSLRDIQLKRGGKTLVHLDVYDFLLNGEKRGDLRLEPGDVIYIPPSGPLAAVDGDVNKPAIFELRGDTTVEQLLGFAGGLSPVAATDRASLDRIVSHQSRETQDFPLTGAQNLIPVHNGDVLRVFPISPRFDKAVTLRGNVGEPGRYAWHEGMRVSDLIPSRQFLITRRYYNEQNALTPAIADRPFASSSTLEPARTQVENENNFSVANRSSNANANSNSNANSNLNTSTSTNTIPTAQNAQNPNTGAVSQTEAAARATGAVPAPPSGQLPELGNHETEINWNYAVLERLDPKTLKSELVPFALGEAIDTPSSPENKLLQPGDVITVYSRDDINLPVELRARFVRIDGEVVRPGVYQLEGNETLRDLVTRAGGIAPHGYLYAAQLTRESVRIAQDVKIQQYVAQAARDVLSPAMQQSQVDGRVNDLDIRRAYVSALGRIRATGRITLQIPPGASTLADVPAVLLQDGDRFFVPAEPTTVDVIGNVFNAGSLLYSKASTVHHYLKLAGDKTRTGDKGQEFLLRADGTVLSRQTHSRFERLLIYPGDTVVVPPRLKTPFNFYQLVGLTQSFGNIAITALALSTIQ